MKTPPVRTVPSGNLPALQTKAQRDRALFQLTGEADVTQKKRGVPAPDSYRGMRPDGTHPARANLLVHHRFERDTVTGQILDSSVRMLINVMAASGVKVKPELLRAASLERIPTPDVQRSLEPQADKILAGRGRKSTLSYFLGNGAKSR